MLSFVGPQRCSWNINMTNINLKDKINQFQIKMLIKYNDYVEFWVLQVLTVFGLNILTSSVVESVFRNVECYDVDDVCAIMTLKILDDATHSAGKTSGSLTKKTEFPVSGNTLP